MSNDFESIAPRCSPVMDIDTGSEHKRPEEGIALCLSGGGYRAMLFHLGALWRLNELSFLKKIKRISSVSGGSIVAAVLGLSWSKLAFDEKQIANNFINEVVDPIRNLADTTIDRRAIIAGLLLPGRISNCLANIYKKKLFGNKTLQDLPDDPPRFVINATNVQSGALWRFMKPYMRDWKVGKIMAPEISLADAVAASSAFPPVLSPFRIRLHPKLFTPLSGQGLQYKPFTSRIVLSDGGIYDNLGLETVWKRYSTILVSDGGGGFKSVSRPKNNWLSHSFRTLQLIDNQVRSLRKRQVIQSFILGAKKGAYWGIRSNIADYQLCDALACPYDKTLELANTKTRLKKIRKDTQEKLINWGYAVCDAAIRKHLEGVGGLPKTLPYPSSGV